MYDVDERAIARLVAPWIRGNPCLIALLVVLLACATSPDTRRADLVAYLHQLRDWAPQDAEAAATVRRLLDSQFADESEVRHQIADSRPEVAAQLERAREYQPRTTELEAIHRRYRDAWATLLRAYDEIGHGLDRGDQAALSAGRRDLLAWRRAITAVAADVGELADRYDARSEAGPPAPSR